MRPSWISTTSKCPSVCRRAQQYVAVDHRMTGGNDILQGTRRILPKQPGFLQNCAWRLRSALQIDGLTECGRLVVRVRGLENVARPRRHTGE